MLIKYAWNCPFCILGVSLSQIEIYKFGPNYHLLPYLVHASSECSCETARMHMLLRLCWSYYTVSSNYQNQMYAQFQKVLREGVQIWQRCFSWWGVRNQIQIPLKADHHRPASETPLNGVSLAGWWWPNSECWLGSFVIFPWDPYNHIALWFSSGWGSGPPVPSSGSAHVMYGFEVKSAHSYHSASNVWYMTAKL